MRTLFIAGNWKMNPVNAAAASDLAGKVKVGVGPNTKVHMAICPPAVFLHLVDTVLEGSPVTLGAQNMHWEPKGAFTGELSGAMLLDTGCTHVILGHSERRHGMGETDEMVNKKTKSALDVGLIPIVCIGETLDEREAGRTLDVLATQLEGSLAELSPHQVAGLVLAYEPVWAIGTGKVATPEQAQEAHAFVRSRLATLFGEATANRVVVQYGGSVKPDNARELLACPDIDGALVGGASLSADDFLGIFRAGLEVAGAGKA